MPTLRNWSIATENPYQAPELARPCGLVYDHPTIPDGSHIRTSRPVARRGDVLLTESGREYRLEGIDPMYEEAFPDARERLLASLPEVVS